MARNRLILSLEILLFAGAFLDVVTGYMFLATGAAAILLGAAVFALILSRGWLRLVWFTLLAACFVVHLSYSEYIRYETRNWEEVRARKTAEALERSAAALGAIYGEVASLATRAAADGPVARGLENGDYRQIFSALDSHFSGNVHTSGLRGLAVTDTSGDIVAWAGSLPGVSPGAVEVGAGAHARLFLSTTGYWLEASEPVKHGEGVVGRVYALRMIDALYPGALSHGIKLPLSANLSRSVNHTVEFLPAGGEGIPAAGGDAVSGEDAAASGHGVPLGAFRLTETVRLPGGEVAGTLVVEGRDIVEEAHLLRDHSLLIASVLVLVLLLLGTARLGRRLLGSRPAQAGAWNVVLFCLLLAGFRLGLSLLRDPLGLSAAEAFAPYYYATHFPGHILRSPADLAITAALACLGAVAAIVTWVKRSRKQRPAHRAAGPERLPNLLLGLLVAALASTTIALSDYLLRTVYADTSMNLLSLSPLMPSWPEVAMKAGLFLLAAGILLVGSALVALSISRLRRGMPDVAGEIAVLGAGAAVLYAFMIALASLGAGWYILLAALPCLVGAAAIDAARMRKINPGFVSPSVGLVGLTVGFVLGASLLQFPHALDGFYSRGRVEVEAAAADIDLMANQWEELVLQGTVESISDDQGIRRALRRRDADFDSEALRLWASTFVSKSGSPSGVYVLDANGRELGRFSVEDVGEFSELEGFVRDARLSPVPTRIRRRASIGGREAEMYMGVAPIVEGDDYLGSVIVTIPYFYGDLESIMGLKTTFFRAVSVPLDNPGGVREYHASKISSMRIEESTASYFEVGSRVSEIQGLDGTGYGWIRHRVAGKTFESYFVPRTGRTDGLLLSFRRLTPSERAVYFMGVTVTNLLFALVIVILYGLAQGIRSMVRAMRGLPYPSFRWSFTRRLAIAFVLIATVPTLILGATSRGYLSARLREVMESKAGESLRLAELSLERLIMDEAMHLAQNPILIDELIEEPSILAMLVSPEVSAAVFDARSVNIASFGEPSVPLDLVTSVISMGRAYYYYDLEDGLTGKTLVPVRDMLFPDRIRGCAFVSRLIDDGVAAEVSSQLGIDVNFYGGPGLEATSKREVFLAELMPSRVSPGAYVECFIRGREVHYAWERIESTDLVVGYSPLREVGGTPVGAISVPLVSSKDDVGRRLEWTVSAISYLLVVIIGIVFAVGLVVARRISKPISQLIQGTLRVSSGDLSFSIPSTGDDEIGDLVSSFNKMTHALNRSRNALNERKRYIETILSNVGAGIVSTDRRGRIAAFNNAAGRILNVKGKHARGRDARNLLSKSGATGLADVIRQLDRDDMVRREVSYERRDGTVMTLRAVGSRMRDARRKTLGKVIVFEDISGLIKSKKLTAWSEMARQVAHEIKNPLTPMKLSAQHLLQAYRDRAEDFDDVLEDGVAIIIEQIESLRRIAIEFSQFSRMPERRVVPADLNEIVEESLAQYERALGSSVEIEKSLPAVLPQVEVDRDEMKRVFLNIIENAVQSMPGGGKLRVASAAGSSGAAGTEYKFMSSSRAVHDEGLKDFVEVSFADTGCGIPRDNLDRLFEPSFSTKTQGSGLGLAISKGIIDAYGGEITIESEQGRGTLVRVRIPCQGDSTYGRHPRRTGSRRKHRPRRR